MSTELSSLVDDTFGRLRRLRESLHPEVELRRIGRVASVSDGVARVVGLNNAQAEELVRFRGGQLGVVFDISPDEAGVILLDEAQAIEVGSETRRTNRVLDVPVGESLIGRIVDALGRPLDRRGGLVSEERRPVERPAVGIMDRAPVDTPLETGIKSIDALIPIGRGQRELILGDRQTGKTAVALDAILNQEGKNVLCIYCVIGQRNTAVAKAIAALRERRAMDYSLVVSATGSDPPGQQFICPFAAMSMAEFFMEQGTDVLLVFDDLTRHAQAYRELSLLLRRPPGREAFPGDIFYLHSRLLERSTRLRPELGGGSITALPIVETEAQNLSAYIPTNLISITDGQVYLSPNLFHKGILPAIDIGKSVSRVGGKAQLPAYRVFAGNLRLSYSQFEELEMFARFGTRLEADTQSTLEHGRPASDQIVVLLAAANGVFDAVSPDHVASASQAVLESIRSASTDLLRRIEHGEKLSREEEQTLVAQARNTLASHGYTGEAAEPD